MKKFLTLLLISTLSIPCFALTDTLFDESTIKAAEEKVIQAEKYLESARAAAKEARERSEKIKKKFNQAAIAFEKAPDAETREKVLPTFSQLTEKHGQAIDDALLAEDRVQKSELALQAVKQELENLREKMGWTKNRIRHR